jgi:hypothetical protein
LPSRQDTFTTEETLPLHVILALEFSLFQGNCFRSSANRIAFVTAGTIQGLLYYLGKRKTNHDINNDCQVSLKILWTTDSCLARYCCGMRGGREGEQNNQLVLCLGVFLSSVFLELHSLDQAWKGTMVLLLLQRREELPKQVADCVACR